MESSGGEGGIDGGDVRENECPLTSPVPEFIAKVLS